VTPDQLVDHPPHYTKGGAVECIEALKSALTADEYRGYLKGNILKYAWRERHKNRLQDIKKLRWYANELVNHLENTLVINEDQ
jgi:hypothetical protein